MPDLKLVQVATPVAVTFDLLQTPIGQLDETDALATAVIVALGTDRRANADDTLPDDDSDDRRGWWGDQDAGRIWQGWPVGSRLWLLERAKITDSAARQGSTVARVDAYIREALRPFIVNKIASRIEVDVERLDIGTIGAIVKMYRGPVALIELRFQSLWSEIEGG
jgi:phage gp46-like protein